MGLIFFSDLEFFYTHRTMKRSNPDPYFQNADQKFEEESVRNLTIKQHSSGQSVCIKLHANLKVI